MAKLDAAMPALAAGLAPDGLTSFGEAILTTDTFPKLASARGRVGGAEVNVAGVAEVEQHCE